MSQREKNCRYKKSTPELICSNQRAKKVGRQVPSFRSLAEYEVKVELSTFSLVEQTAVEQKSSSRDQNAMEKIKKAKRRSF